MSKLYKVVLLAMSLVLISYGNSENDNQTSQKETQKTEITETSEVKVDLKNDPWIKDAKYDKNVSDDELQWINKVTKLIAEKDSREILKILGASAKDFANGDPLSLDPAYGPLSLSGRIKKIVNNAGEITNDSYSVGVEEMSTIYGVLH